MRGNETDNVIICIKTRQTPQYKHYSISKILELCNMETYINVCMNRILSRADEINSGHLICTIDFNFHEFSVDYIGYMQFEDIIGGYIGNEMNEKLQRLFECDYDVTNSERAMVSLLFELNVNGLRKLKTNLKTLNSHAANNELLLKYVDVEMKYRNKANVIYRALIRNIAKLIKEARVKRLAKLLLNGGYAHGKSS